MRSFVVERQPSAALCRERPPFGIFGWACFSTTIGLVLESIRSSDSIVAKILAWVLSSIWGYMTFLSSRCWSSRV